MGPRLPLDRQHLAATIAQRIDSLTWRRRLIDLLDPDSSITMHVAVMREPYLQLVLDGRKTIESRFSVNRTAPFRAAAPEDVILLKAQSGPIVGLALIEHVGFYELDPPTWQTLRRDFEAALCARDDAFWIQRAHTRYASLLRVTEPMQVHPVVVAKTDRRGWVRLPGRGSSQQILAI